MENRPFRSFLSSFSLISIIRFFLKLVLGTKWIVIWSVLGAVYIWASLGIWATPALQTFWGYVSLFSLQAATFFAFSSFLWIFFVEFKAFQNDLREYLGLFRIADFLDRIAEEIGEKIMGSILSVLDFFISLKDEDKGEKKKKR